MYSKLNKFIKSPSFKIVFVYTIVGVIYSFTRNYLLNFYVSDYATHRLIETHLGYDYTLITAVFLYFLIKKNVNQIHYYYKQLIYIKDKKDKEYIALFNHSPIPKWLYDIDTLDFILVNEAACALYGYTKKEFLALNVKDIRPKEYIADLEQALATALDDGSYPNEIITCHRKKNGEEIQVKIEARYVNYKGKKVKLAYAIDLTEQLKFQRKLTETNSKLELASQIAKLGYFTVDLSSMEIQWSDESYKIFEINPAEFELTVENIKNCFHPDDQLDFNSNIIAKFTENAVLENERRIQTPSGKTKWVLERQYIVKDENEKPIRLDGIFLDVTKRKLNEKDLLESNERFKIIAKATVEAIMDWDIVNDTVLWGDGFNSIFGYDLSTYNNNLWSDNIYPDDKEKVLADLYKTLNDSTKENFSAEFRFLKANGAITYVKHKGILIRDENGKAIRQLAAMIDITADLEKLHKIENQYQILKEIAWTQSHVVRAPLSNLMGLVELLKDNIHSDVHDDKIIEYITDSAAKLDSIIRAIVTKTNELEKM